MTNVPLVLRHKVAFVAIREYAAHSYLYYDKDKSVVSDADYDALCKWLLDNYDWKMRMDEQTLADVISKDIDTVSKMLLGNEEG